MSLWDRFGATMTPQYDESALNGEGVIKSWAGCILRGRLSTTGGRLVLTQPALIFSPLDLQGTIKAIKLVLDAIEVPGEQVLTQVVENAQKAPLSIALNNIGSLEATGDARLLTPPSARLTTEVGSVHNFGLLKNIGHPNRSKDNEPVLADFVQTVKAHVPSAV